jgi:hypothetical protein
MKEIKIWFDHRTDLPTWITSRIGQIVVDWSVLERELEEPIQMLVNTNIGFTRSRRELLTKQTVNFGCA